ncbi:MAG TPA: Gfo/Idh/MocA family oxidoreductase [Vicinamibacteria bacterium]
MAKRRATARVRYAVVGLGHIAQKAVLPAFAHARRNSELAALVSDDPVKLRKMGRKYRVKSLYGYAQYEECLKSGHVDAVYIALPNTLHREYTERAARAGVHVLCEKPLAVTASDCEAMIRAAREGGVKLMTAYRLHFEKANLEAVRALRSGRLGEPRIFSSVFTIQVKDENNVRLKKGLGGGTLYDIGIYCINAARYLFRDEPVEAAAVTARSGDRRFREVEEMTSAILRFPQDRLASFTVGFGAQKTASYDVVGTKGRLRLENAYEYAAEVKETITVGKRTRQRTYPQRDQFAAELVYFSECVLKGSEPEPSGDEGLADVRIIEALYRSAETGRPVRLTPTARAERPTPAQEIRRPKVRKPETVHVRPPSAE